MKAMPDIFDFEDSVYEIHPLDDVPDEVLRRKAELRLGEGMTNGLSRRQILSFLKGE